MPATASSKTSKAKTRPITFFLMGVFVTMVAQYALSPWKDYDFQLAMSVVDSSSNPLLLSNKTTTTESASSPTEPVWDKSDTWKPLNCTDYLHSVFHGKQKPVLDPNRGRFYARWTETSNPFWIVLHNESVDHVRWETMFYGLYYERKLSVIFQQILREAPPHARVVDVGGNIGWFSFLSASMQAHVDVFEPLPINLIRQCQAAHLNEFGNAAESEINHRTVKRSSINLRSFGVSDGEGEATMTHERSNPGSAKLNGNAKFGGSQISLTSLDRFATDLGWLDDKSNTLIAILKIDIEGGEIKAVNGAQRLLRSGLVQNILMEVTRGNETERKSLEQMLGSVLTAGFYLYQWGGYRGPDLPPNSPQGGLKIPYPVDGTISEQANHMANHLYPIRMHQSNLWFKPKPNR